MSIHLLGCALSAGLATSALNTTAAQTVCTEEQKLIGEAWGDNFGMSVSMSGEVSIVGDRWSEDNGQESGSAYIYRYDGSAWMLEQKLLAEDGGVLDWFGHSVAIREDMAIVGASGDYTGSAYVFRYDGSVWIQEQKLNRRRTLSGHQQRRTRWLGLCLPLRWRLLGAGTEARRRRRGL
jgi:hypothetical protein